MSKRSKSEENETKPEPKRRAKGGKAAGASATEAPAAEAPATEASAAEPVVEEKKPSGEKVLVRRFKDEYTVMGPPRMVRPIEEVAEGLTRSEFMRPWLIERVIEHLRAGHELVNRSLATGNPKSIYKLCTQADLEELSAAGELEQATTTSRDLADKKRSGAKISRASVVYRLPAVARTDKPSIMKLQKQGRIILEIMRERLGDGGGIISAQELRVLLEANRERIKTGQDVMKLFGFHASQFYRKMEPPLIQDVRDDGAEPEPPVADEDEE